mgnify:CR=1 FL=1
MSLLSVIVPCYNEEESVALFYQELTKNDPFFKEKEIELELLYIDDGSKDGTVREVKKLIEQDSRVHIVSFSRNFGKEAAMFAGLEKSKGDYVVMMDVDLQDPPELLPKMYEMVKSGICDSVATRRSDRTGEPVIRSFLSENFYKFINKISKTQLVYGARDYRIMCRKMVDAVLQMSEYNRFSKGIFSWVGFRTEWLEYENVERSAGETKWSLRQLFKYSLEGITGFSVAPLSVAAVLGVVFCGVSFLMILFLVIRTLIWGDPVAGWPSMVCVILFMGGIQLLCMGIMGEYLSKTYLESKHRPIYIIRSSSYEKE